MPRSVADATIMTKTARERLAERHQPYWRGVDAGAAVGYRKGKAAGAFLARVVDSTAGGGYRQTVLGRADDALKADGVDVLDYRQAEAKARDWIARHHRVVAGLDAEPATAAAAPYTVTQAVADYLADFASRGGKSVANTRQAADAHIIPALGALVVTALKRERIRFWHRALATAPARLRSKKGATHPRAVNENPDATRPRRATANRILTILKAALNHARAEGKVTGSADAWTAVKPFREADQAKVRYLLDDDVTRLVKACPPDFRELVIAALLTGCRYGELAAMKAGDFDAQAGTVTIGSSKGGKSRHVVVTDEGRGFFERHAAGKGGGALLFQRDLLIKQATKEAKAEFARAAWGKSHQFRLLREACKAASIAPAVSFHILRHTYASRLARAGAPMAVIAAQLGHSDTRMTEKHYAHLSPSYVADTVRQTFSSLGIGQPPSGAAILPMQPAKA